MPPSVDKNLATRFGLFRFQGPHPPPPPTDWSVPLERVWIDRYAVTQKTSASIHNSTIVFDCRLRAGWGSREGGTRRRVGFEGCFEVRVPFCLAHSLARPRSVAVLLLPDSKTKSRAKVKRVRLVGSINRFIFRSIRSHTNRSLPSPSTNRATLFGAGWPFPGPVPLWRWGLHFLHSRRTSTSYVVLCVCVCVCVCVGHAMI